MAEHTTDHTSPVFVYVHGSFHNSSTFDSILPLMHSSGFAGIAINLPSMMQRVSSLNADVQAVREPVTKILDSGRDVVLVMHSFGGVVGTEAMKYFLDNDSDCSNGKGRIRRMVYIAAFIIPKGQSLIGSMPKQPDWWRIAEITEDNTWVTPAAGASITLLYSDLPAAIAAEHASKLRPQSMGGFQTPLTVEPYTHIPAGYLLCEDDVVVPVAKQEGMLNLARSKWDGDGDGWLVEKVKSGHIPFFSRPETVVSFLVKCAV